MAGTEWWRHTENEGRQVSHCRVRLRKIPGYLGGGNRRASGLLDSRAQFKHWHAGLTGYLCPLRSRRPGLHFHPLFAVCCCSPSSRCSLILVSFDSDSFENQMKEIHRFHPQDKCARAQKSAYDTDFLGLRL